MTSDPLIAAYIVLALIASGFTKGVSGTGLPLVAVPLLTFALELPAAVALITVSILGTNAVQAATSKQVPAAISRYWSLMIMIPFGTLLGTFLLAHLDPDLTERATGIIVIAFLAYLISGKRAELPANSLRWAAPLTGFSAGVFGGMTAIFAPPMLMLLLWQREAKELFVATLAVTYIVASFALILALAAFQLMDLEMFAWSCAAFLPVLVGQMAGTNVRHLISEDLFHRCVQAILFAAGLKMLLH